MVSTRNGMTDEHKEALALGREQGRIVRSYLEGLETHRPKRGRKRTIESIEKRLAVIDGEMATDDPLKRLQLTQERLQLEEELAAGTGGTVDLQQLENRFVEVAGDWGWRKGISYAAWREIGVPASVLRRAGISRAGYYD